MGGRGLCPRPRPGAPGQGVGLGALGAGTREESPGTERTGAGSSPARAVPGAPAALNPGRT